MGIEDLCMNKKTLQQIALERADMAKQLLRHAGFVTAYEHGVTIIVHDNANAKESTPAVALISSLPDRATTRGLLASVLVEALAADGKVNDNLDIVPGSAESDLFAWLNRHEA